MVAIQPTHDLLISHGMIREHNKKVSAEQRAVVVLRKFLKPQYQGEVIEAILQCRDMLDYSRVAQRGDHIQLTPTARQLLWELQSGMTLRGLENAAGLHNLFPDAHCNASGIVDWQSRPEIHQPAALHGQLLPCAHLEILLQGSNACITNDNDKYLLNIGDAILMAHPYAHTSRSGSGALSLVISYFTHSPAEGE